ncbi:MAG: hypothetical protein FJ087_15050 [Deltaproteobacteria bacterium]|nr:hypothetical protein [Deltaproteobacteria bacterium]
MRRLKRLLSPVAATAALLLVSLLALPWVRDRSDSLASDRAIILAWAGLALLAGWLQVAALPWGGGGNGAEDPRSSSPFRRTALLRSVLLGVAVLANLAWSDMAAGGFWFGHYSRFGPDDTELRSPSPEVRRAALRRLAEVMQPRLVDAVPRVSAAKADPDPSVRAMAVLALGHVARRMGVAIATLRAEGALADRWEPAALEAARRALGDPSVPIRTLAGEERRAWVRAAGATADPAFAGTLAAVVEDPASPRDDVLEAAGALSDVPHAAALPGLVAALSSSDPDVAVRAAWGIGLVAAGLVRTDAAAADADHRFRAAEETMARVLPSLDAQAACAYLAHFPQVADVRLTGALIALATPATFARECARVERPNPIGRPEVVVKEGPVADRVLDAMRAIVVGNRDLRGFLAAASKDPAWPDGLRERFAALLAAAGEGQQSHGGSR